MIIAANDSPNDKYGFLGRREYGMSKILDIATAAADESHHVCVRPRRRWFRDQLGHSPDIKRREGRSALGKRGWPFQERLLARRILHYVMQVIHLSIVNGIGSQWKLPVENSHFALMFCLLYAAL
jgi:hypothetical protein